MAYKRLFEDEKPKIKKGQIIDIFDKEISNKFFKAKVLDLDYDKDYGWELTFQKSKNLPAGSAFFNKKKNRWEYESF